MNWEWKLVGTGLDSASWTIGSGRQLGALTWPVPPAGAEREVYPVTVPLSIPVVAFTGLRWGALPRIVAQRRRYLKRALLFNLEAKLQLGAESSRLEVGASTWKLDPQRCPGFGLYR